MKNITLNIVIFLCIFTAAAQQKKTLRIQYVAYPISTHDAPPKDSPKYKNQGAIVALAQSYEHHYSLYVDTETLQSVYRLDTLIVKDKPKGQEGHNYMINDKLDYVVRKGQDSYLKHETIFQREFYSEGNPKDIEWEITQETRTISGMPCRKAIAKDKSLLLTVWFTDKVPVSSGPVNYFGLPGLVVWAEDFFWTTEISAIDYVEGFDLKKEIDTVNQTFDKNKKGKFIEESLLLVKKAELVKSMIEQMKS